MMDPAYEWWLNREGQPRALDQDMHRRINARHYPGTRELCVDCDAPTGRAGRGEDSIYIGDHGPLCEQCREQKEPGA